MSLLEALAEAPAPRSAPCRFGLWVATLTTPEQDAVWNAVDTWPSMRDLADRISREGYPVSFSTIANHRNRVCRSCRSPKA